MTIYRLVKVASTIAILGLSTHAFAEGDADHVHGAMTTSATPTMDHSAMDHSATTPVMDHSAMDHSATTPAMDHSATTPTMDHSAMDHSATTPAMDHSAMTTSETPAMDHTATGLDPLLENINKNVASGAISGGMGINYVGKFIFNNKMTKFDMTKGLFGTDLTIINQPNGFAGFAGDKHATEAITIPPLRSMSWNNTQSNPDETTTDLAKGFGSGLHSQWYLVDLSKLSSGKYYVSIKLERFDDGQAVEVAPATATTAEQTLPSDDDLVPAITVFDGYQNRGISGSWFPNQFQNTTTPFWAEMLKPESALLGANSAKAGFDTAFGAAENDRAQVSGVIKLDSAGKVAKTNRYLTIAIGGDDRTTKHDVNYQLTVKVHSCVGAPCGSN